MRNAVDSIRLVYSALDFEEHRQEVRLKLTSFLKDSQSKYLLMCEPVGFGKTSMLIEEALLPRNSETGEFRNVIFLTYSYSKSVEIHQKLLDEINEWPNKPRIVRSFSADLIHKEEFYRRSGDIRGCKNEDARKKEYQKENGSAWGVCKKCNFKSRCPYYRSQIEFREEQVNIFVGTLAELQSPGFYFNKADKFLDADFVVLDEDGARKAVITKEFERKQLEFFIYYIEIERKKALEDKKLEPHQRQTKANFFDALYSDLQLKIGLLAWSKFSDQKPDENYLDDKPHKNSLSDRGVIADETKIEKFTDELAALPQSEQKKIVDRLYRKWSKILDIAFRTNAKLNFSTKREWSEDKLYLSIFPSLPFRKVIFTDATTVSQEVYRRFSSGNDHVWKTFEPQVNGVLIPKGKIYQVVENVAKTQFFNKGELNSKKLKSLMEKLSELANDLGFRDGKTSIIAFSELVDNKMFQTHCKKYGFICDPKMYHGAVRGLNSIESNDLIILGSTFPDDKQVKKDQFSQFDGEVPYNYSDFYLLWQQTADGAWYIDPTFDMKNLGVQKWANNMARERGLYGRKIYLENVLQSLRSRFYWHDTKTLVFCPYPLTDFGIAVHELKFGILNSVTPEQLYTLMKLDRAIRDPFTLEEINHMANEKFESLDVIARGFRDHGLPCSIDGTNFYVINRDLLSSLSGTSKLTSKSRKKR